MIAEEAIAFLAGGLFCYAEFLQFSQGGVDGGICEAGFFFQFLGAGDWMTEHGLMNQRSRFATPADGLNFFPVFPDLLVQGHDDFQALCRGGDDGFGEEVEPAFPVALVSDGVQRFVIVLAMELEIVAQVEERLLQYFSFAKQQGNQETPDSSVTIEEGMDGLELDVG